MGKDPCCCSWVGATSWCRQSTWDGGVVTTVGSGREFIVVMLPFHAGAYFSEWGIPALFWRRLWFSGLPSDRYGGCHGTLIATRHSAPAWIRSLVSPSCVLSNTSAYFPGPPSSAMRHCSPARSRSDISRHRARLLPLLVGQTGDGHIERRQCCRKRPSRACPPPALRSSTPWGR